MNFNKNKETIYKKLDELKTHPTVYELYEELKKTHPNIGIATIYRNLGKLLDEKRIIKISSPNEKDRFDATIKNHHHARCIICGHLKDINMDINFKVKEDIKLVGIDVSVKYICEDCARRK